MSFLHWMQICSWPTFSFCQSLIIQTMIWCVWPGIFRMCIGDAVLPMLCLLTVLSRETLNDAVSGSLSSAFSTCHRAGSRSAVLHEWLQKSFRQTLIFLKDPARHYFTISCPSTPFQTQEKSYKIPRKTANKSEVSIWSKVQNFAKGHKRCEGMESLQSCFLDKLSAYQYFHSSQITGVIQFWLQ